MMRVDVTLFCGWRRRLRNHGSIITAFETSLRLELKGEGGCFLKPLPANARGLAKVRAMMTGSDAGKKLF